MQGIININGYIGSFQNGDEEVRGVELIDIVTQVQAQADCDSFLVKINSKGGVCEVGYAIRAYLETCGKEIHTETTGSCCSMATIINGAGKTRTAIEPCDFRPHNPWTSDLSGDADEIAAAAEGLRAIEDRMIETYAKDTGISKEGIDAILKLDKSIPLQQALELKFITQIKPALKAVAVLKTKKDMAISAEDKKKLSLLDKIKAMLDPNKTKALQLTADDGTVLDVTNADGTDISGQPTEGCLVMIGGSPAPDGIYEFPDLGYSIDVLMGAVTAVTAYASAAQKAAAKKKEDEEKAKKELAAKTLEEQLKVANETIAAKDKEISDMKEANEALGVKIVAIEKAVSTFKSTHIPADEHTIFKLKTQKEVEDVKAAALKAKERYKSFAKK